MLPGRASKALMAGIALAAVACEAGKVPATAAPAGEQASEAPAPVEPANYLGPEILLDRVAWRHAGRGWPGRGGRDVERTGLRRRPRDRGPPAVEREPPAGEWRILSQVRGMSRRAGGA